jgi:glyoxalase/bleomycin resistance protein/dioxygenase superfamily protein
MIDRVERLVDQFERGALPRREFVLGLAALAAGCAAPARAQESRPPSTRPAAGPLPVRGYSHAALSVSDVARSAAFYRDHFGMRVTSEGARSAFLSMGEPSSPSSRTGRAAPGGRSPASTTSPSRSRDGTSRGWSITCGPAGSSPGPRPSGSTSATPTGSCSRRAPDRRRRGTVALDGLTVARSGRARASALPGSPRDPGRRRTTARRGSPRRARGRTEVRSPRPFALSRRRRSS